MENENNAISSNINDENETNQLKLKQEIKQKNDDYSKFSKLTQQEHDELNKLIWGDNVKDEVFERWSQGIHLFYFF